MSETLDRDRILQVAGNAVTAVEVFQSLPSTNRYLADAVRSGRITQPLAVLAETQSAGVGRRGKAWSSPAGNISLSLLSVFDVALARLNGLSLVTGVTVSEVLARECGLQVALKWPNDVLLEGRKLAGLLVEVPSANSDRACLVTGIGLNVIAPEEADISQPVASLAEAETPPSRNALAGHLIAALHANYQRFLAEGITPFLAAWRDQDYLRGREVNVIVGDHTERGTACGITPGGELQVRIDGVVKNFNSGEVSVRRA